MKIRVRMSSAASHNIDLSNFHTEDHVRHSIVLVKGKVNGCDSLSYEAITIHNASANVTFRSKELKKRDNAVAFKCLICLRRGENRLKLTFGPAERSFTLHYDAPEQPPYVLKVFYVISRGHDGTFQSEDAANSAEIACQRITLAIQLIQCLIAEKLFEAGFERNIFQFIECSEFHSSLPLGVARTWNASQLWHYHAKEMLVAEMGGNRHVKYICILAGTLYENGKILANAALGAGDVAVYGSGCLFSWPSSVHDVTTCFRDGRLVDRSKLLDDSNGRRSYGGCFATSLGSLCHEIGHIFDLGHTSGGIMGTGFDFSNRFFTVGMPTEVLAPRQIDSCQSTSDDNRSGLNLDRRLTRVKKTNRFLMEYHSQRDSDDHTYFHDNCNVMLFYHKWFNQFNSCTPHEIQFNRINSTVSSKLPIRLVEIRDKSNGMCLQYRIFNDSNEHKYVLPLNDFKCDFNILVLDSQGNLARF